MFAKHKREKCDRKKRVIRNYVSELSSRNLGQGVGRVFCDDV